MTYTAAATGVSGAGYDPAPGRSRMVGVLRVLRTDPLHTVLTVVVDLSAAAVAVAVADRWAAAHQASDPTGVIWLFAPFVVGLLAARSMYRRGLHRNFLDELGPLQTSVALAALLVLTMLVLLDGQRQQHGPMVVRMWLCAAMFMAAARLLRAVCQRVLRKRLPHGAPTLIVGNGRIAHLLMTRMAEMPEYGLRPIGILDAPTDDPTDEFSQQYQNLPYLGTPDQLVEIARSTGAEEVIIAFSLATEQTLVPAVRAAHGMGIRVWVVPRMFDAVGARSHVEHLGGLPLLVLPQVDPRGWQFAVKHVLDVAVTAIGLLLISPVMLTLALLVRLSSPGPIFFRQARVGRDGQVFDCLKFRSMRTADELGDAFHLTPGTAPGGVEGADRRTTVGAFMRATSLDELPQLINVLRGDMSLVGPRPERPEYVERFELQVNRYGERHRVKAGITGWAQVHGLRGQTSITDRAEWDNYYIENFSLLLDLRIMALTVLTLFRRSEN